MEERKDMERRIPRKKIYNDPVLLQLNQGTEEKQRKRRADEPCRRSGAGLPR